MAPKKEIPARTKKLIIQEATGVCAFCKEKNVCTLEFHHINGREVDRPNDPDNLIYVCKNCHGRITAGEISVSDVILQKRILKFTTDSNQQSFKKSNIVNIDGSIQNSTIANEIKIYGNKSKSIKINAPEGSISASLNSRNYLKQLIDHYHEFAKAEKGQAFKYQVFYAAIKRKFGAKWDLITIHQFDDVCEYVQTRIDKTALGRNRKSKGQKNYNTFAEYLDKYVNTK